MKTFLRIVKSENFFVLVVLTLGMFLSLLPMFHELLRRNEIFSDRQFVLVYNFAPDYNAYLSKIIQGIQGRWAVVEYFTSEPHRGSLLQIFYVMVGKAGSIFSSNPEVAYHSARILFGIGWILVGWQFIKFSFISKLYRKIALLFFIFGGNMPHLVDDQAGYGFLWLGKKWDQSMVGWSNLDPVRRMTFIPHWNAGHVMGILALLFFIKHIQNQKSIRQLADKNQNEDTKMNYSSSAARSQVGNSSLRRVGGSNNKILEKLLSIKYLVLSIVLALAAGFTLPSMLVGLYSILGLWFVYKIIPPLISVLFFELAARSSRSYSSNGSEKFADKVIVLARPSLTRTINSYLKQNSYWLISLTVFFTLTFTSLIYNLWITSFFPWKALVETDLYINKIAFPYWNYFMGLGPIGFFGVGGAFLAFFLHKQKLYWSSFWVLGMFVLIVFFDKVINWHDQTRFLEVGPELPLSILSVLTLAVLGSVFGKFKNYFVLSAAALLMIMAGLLFSISITAQNDFIDHKILGSYPKLSLGNYVVYPVKSVMDAVAYLKNNTKDDEVILSGYITGNHIGAYAGKFVYMGHGSQTVHFYQEKQPRAIEFYQGRMEENTAKKFLQNSRIKYVVFGPEERTYGEYPTKVNFLKEVFKSGDVIVYRVNF